MKNKVVTEALELLKEIAPEQTKRLLLDSSEGVPETKEIICGRKWCHKDWRIYERVLEDKEKYGTNWGNVGVTEEAVEASKREHETGTVIAKRVAFSYVCPVCHYMNFMNENEQAIAFTADFIKVLRDNDKHS